MSAKSRCHHCQHPRGPRRGKASCPCPCHLPPAPPEPEICAECHTLPAVTTIPVSELPGAPKYPYPVCGPCAAEIGAEVAYALG